MFSIGVGGNQEEEKPRTRCGYLPNESLRSFEKGLGQAGAVASGRCLHFAADIVCSGGLELCIRSLWEYAICHIGIASPRIFVYLKQRTEQLLGILKHLPDEQAYASEEFQVRVGEMVIVAREAPTRTAVAWPRVMPETHEEGWLVAAATAPETAALRRVWRSGGDQPTLRIAGAELCKAIGDGSTERALWWVKWLFEEEGLVRKATKGASLTVVDRGAAGSKSKSGVGHFIVTLYAEIYKELAAKGSVRMHEEFQTLVDTWKQGEKRVQGGAKRALLAVMTQILCEVPRWKVPAAPGLIKDPVAVSMMVRQSPRFFREVLAYDPPKAVAAVVKAFRSRGKVDARAVAKAKKGEAAAAQMDAFDAALEAYFSRG